MLAANCDGALTHRYRAWVHRGQSFYSGFCWPPVTSAPPQCFLGLHCNWVLGRKSSPEPSIPGATPRLQSVVHRTAPHRTAFRTRFDIAYTQRKALPRKYILAPRNCFALCESMRQPCSHHLNIPAVCDTCQLAHRIRPDQAVPPAILHSHGLFFPTEHTPRQSNSGCCCLSLHRTGRSPTAAARRR